MLIALINIPLGAHVHLLQFRFFKSTFFFIAIQKRRINSDDANF